MWPKKTGGDEGAVVMSSDPGHDVPSLLQALRTAELTHTYLSPDDHAVPSSPDSCYDLQHEALAARTTIGSRLVGYKLGLSSAPARTDYGTNEPVHGFLLSDHLLEPTDVTARSFCAPRVEPEIAVVVGPSGIRAGATQVEILRSGSLIAPAIEIVDSRWGLRAPTLGHLIADNVSASAFVVGATMPIDAVALGDRAVHVTVGLNFVVGQANAVFGHPLTALQWVIDTVTAKGLAVRPGHVIMTGSWCSPIPAAAGDRVCADFGPPIGRCEIEFGRVGPS